MSHEVSPSQWRVRDQRRSNIFFPLENPSFEITYFCYQLDQNISVIVGQDINTNFLAPYVRKKTKDLSTYFEH